MEREVLEQVQTERQRLLYKKREQLLIESFHQGGGTVSARDRSGCPSCSSRSARPMNS